MATIQPDPLQKVFKKKSLWRETRRSHWQYFCPSCGHLHTLRFHPNPYQWRSFFQVSLTTLVFTLAAWPIFAWRGVVSFVFFWTVFELVHRIRVRNQISECRYCGFDPYLFLRDADLARERFLDFWRAKVDQIEGDDTEQDEDFIENPSSARPSLDEFRGER